jgi:hypothetical protein
MCSFKSSPLRDLTVSPLPLTASMVPRTRDGVGGCCANAQSDYPASAAMMTSG